MSNEMNAKQFFESISDYEVKAITVDWTSTEIWVNKDGVTKVWHEFTGSIEEGVTFEENTNDFIARIANISCVETTIMREQ